MTIACQLSEKGFGERMDVIRELYSGVLSSEELQDGYEWTYPGNGPIRLSIRGGEGVGEFLEGIRIDGS